VVKEVDVIRLFSADLSRELTILQISKLIKKSYGYTNNKVRELIESGIINKKVIGHSILCTLNIENQQTIALLALQSAIDSEEQIKKSKNEKEIRKTIKQLNKGISSYSENIIYLFETNEVETELSTRKVDSINELKGTIIYNFEGYWRKK